MARPLRTHEKAALIVVFILVNIVWMVMLFTWPPV